MGTQPTKNEPKSHKFTKPKNWAHQIYQQIHLKARFTNTFRALLITRRSNIKFKLLQVIKIKNPGKKPIIILTKIDNKKVPNIYSKLNNSPKHTFIKTHSKIPIISQQL